ncbi:hypothetical protein AMTR_s00138p00036780 [Amborella trichopoda]|uniref:PLATZ transcription factor family protein n=1 Tax=Amborella trichopoda TaxID=13333 RepID=W1NF86_AMBTC|nr:hypothetical protein AMTR_s00138p00036780 [Amborella trichopoda]
MRFICGRWFVEERTDEISLVSRSVILVFSSSSAAISKARAKVRRYVYNDVIRLQDMHKYLDCYQIQTYRINGAKVVFLNARPQTKLTKVLPSKCRMCDRGLKDGYKYCSVSCKVKDVDANKGSNALCKWLPLPEFISFPGKDDGSEGKEDVSGISSCSQDEEEPEEEEELTGSIEEEAFDANPQWLLPVLKPKRKLHKRKGIPRRSPVY